jgi:RNA polymerase sigma-70 factor (ECF subfamily)
VATGDHAEDDEKPKQLASAWRLCMTASLGLRPGDRTHLHFSIMFSHPGRIDARPAMVSGMPSRASKTDFDAAYRAHFGFVWRVLARQGVPAASLEDAVQEVFMVAHRHWGAWDGRASIRAYLFGVARRVAATSRRTQARQRNKLDAMPERSPEVALDDQFDDRERLDHLAAAIDQLDPERRDVFVLSDVEGLSAPEIADALGCKLNTVYSRLRRARASVIEAMASLDRSSVEIHSSASRQVVGRNHG